MVFLRRNWAVLLALILIPLVVLLAILQLNWIRDMGERERFRLRQGLFVAAGELASAFQRELLLAPWALAPPPFGEVPRGKPSAKPAPPPPLRTDAPKGLFSSSLRGGDWAFFAERLRSWRNYALDPDIIGGIHLIEAREKAGASLASWDGSAFVPEKNEELTLRVLALLGDQGQQGRSQAPRFRPGFIRVDEEEWDLVQIPDEEDLAILLRFDIAVLADRVLPRLAALHLGGMSDYRFRIIDRSTGTLLYRSDPKGGDEGFAQADIRFGLFRRNFGGPDAANRNPSGSTRLGEAPVFALRPNRGESDKSHKNRAQHAEFLAQVGQGTVGHRDWVKWFRTLPPFLELDGIRAVHGCWDQTSVDVLRESGWDAGRPLDDVLLAEVANRKTPAKRARQLLLCGLEIPLAEGQYIIDKAG
ncbi:MAG: hypothetical protein WCL50_18790, partial [Spirochaetota bacterium]